MELIDIIIYAVLGPAIAIAIYKDINALPSQIMLSVACLSAISWLVSFEIAMLTGLGVIIGHIYHQHYKQGGSD